MSYIKDHVHAYQLEYTVKENRETILPTDKEHWLKLRSQDVTSTEVSSLFGLSPYCTEFELWHRHNDNTILKIEENDRMKWGTRLQDTIAEGIATDNNWTAVRMDEYIRLPDLRIGSSFDFRINPDDKPMNCDSALLEIKNVDSLIYKENWSVDGDDVEAPPHIELQVQHQLLVSGLKKAYLGAFIGGNKVVLIERASDEKIQNAIIDKVKKFWDSIAAGTPPAPDYTRDSEFITSLYKYAEPGSIYDSRGDAVIAQLAESYREASEAAKAADKVKQSIKAQILEKIGTAEKVLGDTFTSITAGMIGPCDVAYTLEGYRQFRINFKREKKRDVDE